MAITSAQIDDFNAYGRNPETWALAARRSLAVAKVLMGRAEQLRLTADQNFFEFSGCYYAGYFHAGVAVENAAKALLISRDPTIVSKGAVDIKKFGGRTGHELLDLTQSAAIALSDAERRLVEKLEEFVWLVRYTVPRKADVLYDEKKMSNVRLSTSDEWDILHSLVDRIIASIS